MPSEPIQELSVLLLNQAFSNTGRRQTGTCSLIEQLDCMLDYFQDVKKFCAVSTSVRRALLRMCA